MKTNEILLLKEIANKATYSTKVADKIFRET